MKDFKKLREQALRQHYRKKEVFVEGDYVMNAITGQKGKIHRAGVNYVSVSLRVERCFVRG